MKKLVAYFSATGTTKKVALSLSNILKCDAFEIKPQTEYSSADLDWTNKNSRTSIEMANKSSRPQIINSPLNIDDYDIIFLGFPIWWYVAPTIINTFLEHYNFNGKTIILFATSGGSGFGQTVKYLQPSVNSSTTIKEGKILNGNPSKAVLENWLKELNM